MAERSLVDEQKAYAALRASLHQLRDRLTVEEATDLGAQLPLLIRGIYYEGWNPAGKPEKNDREGFLAGVREKLKEHPEIDVDVAVPAVVRLLDHELTRGEVDDVINMMPKDLQQLWPQHTN